MTIQSDDSIRWGDLHALQQRFPGAFGRTRAYELLAAGKLRAKKFGTRTLWDFAAAEELIASLPDYRAAA